MCLQNPEYVAQSRLLTDEENNDKLTARLRQEVHEFCDISSIDRRICAHFITEPVEPNSRATCGIDGTNEPDTKTGNKR